MYGCGHVTITKYVHKHYYWAPVVFLIHPRCFSDRILPQTLFVAVFLGTPYCVARPHVSYLLPLAESLAHSFDIETCLLRFHAHHTEAWCPIISPWVPETGNPNRSGKPVLILKSVPFWFLELVWVSSIFMLMIF